MKKILSTFVISLMFMAGIFSAAIYSNALAQSNSGQQYQDVNKAMNDIYNSQPNGAKCNNISDSQLEDLGKKYMDNAVPDQQQRTSMINMMGGEGSETLKQARINMGRAYMGCWSNFNSSPAMPMMNTMMNYNG